MPSVALDIDHVGEKGEVGRFFGVFITFISDE
jgi:hypothetical protein